MDKRLDSLGTFPTSPKSYPIHPNQILDVLDIPIIKAGCLRYHLEKLSSGLL